MNIISYEEFKNTDLYQKFISENNDVGLLKVQVFTAYNAVPIENTEVVISKDIGNYKVIFFKGTTDSSGIIDNISLPAPAATNSSLYDVPQYTLYDLTTINVLYESIKKYLIGMFGGVKVIQYVKMSPKITNEVNDNYGS